MIVDCYTHTWETADQLGRTADCHLHRRPRLADPRDPLAAGVKRHIAAAQPVDCTFVLGFVSTHLGAHIPNDDVAAYVAAHPRKLIGFAGIDPSDPRAAIDELDRAVGELHMKGVAVSPASQGFHPSASAAMQVYAEVERRGLPVIFHTGVQIAAATQLEYATPILLDEVARELPGLRMVIAHLGHPRVDETLVLLAKHPNVYAEISWILDRPWEAYQALLAAHEHGVTDKILFGSGFPFSSAARHIESLYRINHLVHGTNLPTIPREALRGIVERDALRLLRIDRTETASSDYAEPEPATPAPALDEAEA